MGLEASCTATWDGQTAEGTAHLETESLQFRGRAGEAVRFSIALAAVKNVAVVRGALEVTGPDGTAILHLGQAAAEKWYAKIRYPKSVLDKLGVKPGMRVAVLGIDDPAFLEPLAERTTDIAQTRPKKDSDLIFCLFETPASLDRLAGLRGAIKSNGAIWTVYPKGRKDITQAAVMAAGKAAGLVDVKVVGFSETHSSLKWVIPVADRK
jgi:hypothetical protein